MLRHVPKIYLIFKLPDKTERRDFFRSTEKLGDIVSRLSEMAATAEVEIKTKGLWARIGRKKLVLDKSLADLGLVNDTIIRVSMRR